MNFLETLTRRKFIKQVGGLIFGEQLKIVSKELRSISITSTVLTYHEMWAPSVTQDVVGLIGRGFQPLSFDTFVGALLGEVEIPPGLSTFLVTCDDGLLSHYTQGLRAIFEIERRTGWFVPLTLFVPPRFEGLPVPLENMADDTPVFNDRVHRYINKGQLVQMLQLGHFVENHTVDHKDLTTLSARSRNDNVMYGEERVEQLWRLAGRERNYRGFAYPYGRFAGQADYIAGVGYDVAFTTVGTTRHTGANRWTLGRIGKS